MINIPNEIIKDITEMYSYLATSFLPEMRWQLYPAFSITLSLFHHNSFKA